MSGCDGIREAIPGWAAGELAPEEAARVRRHLEACRDCARLAEAARAVAEAVAPLARLEPPGRAVEAAAGVGCRRWQALLFAALDEPLPEPEARRLAAHLEGCAPCAAVWEGLVAAREVGAALRPGEAAVRRAEVVPRRAALRRVPGLRTASAAAYALALITALLVGNPVTLARQGAERAVSRLGRAVEERVSDTADEGRDEFRLLVWRVWSLMDRTAAAVADIFDEEPRPSAAHGNQGGER